MLSLPILEWQPFPCSGKRWWGERLGLPCEMVGIAVNQDVGGWSSRNLGWEQRRVRLPSAPGRMAGVATERLRDCPSFLKSIRLHEMRCIWPHKGLRTTKATCSASVLETDRVGMPLCGTKMGCGCARTTQGTITQYTAPLFPKPATSQSDVGCYTYDLS